MLCYRCGGHVKDGSDKCVSCGQRFDPGLKAGPAAGFGAGIKRARHAIEGSPCQTGDTVAGRYQVREHVGAGPLGWMYRAFEVNSEQDVALKILSPRFLQMPEEKRTFQAELHKAQRLAHPNIARIYEAGEDQGRPFIAAQHLEGLTLRRIIDLRRQKGQRFTLQEVEPIVAQVAAALDAANSAFAHGNLKPDNVIVLPDLLKLTDFGLAVSLPRAPFMAAQKAAGVHRYLAPEFLLGDPLDARTDVFSLGVMLGEMLAGVQYEQQLSLLDKNPDLPPPVETLFRRAVSPRAAARFASAGEMAAELSELVSAAPRPAPAPKAVEDAGDVVIVEAHTDPRLRIARALGATRAPDAASTPQPPAVAEPQASGLAPQAAEVPPGPAPTIPESAAAVLASLPLAPPEPFTPPPYEPSMPPLRPVVEAAPVVETPIAPAIAPAPLAAPEAWGLKAEAVVEPAVSEPPVAPVAEPSPELAKIAESVGATPELLTAETAVRAAPERPEQGEPPAGTRPPRRGAPKRGRDKLKGRIRRAPSASDPAWTSGAPTEGAVAIGPTTVALEPIQPERPQMEGWKEKPTPASVPVAPLPSPVTVSVPAPVPARRSQPAIAKPSRPAIPSSFVGIEDKRPSRAPLYAVGIVAVLVIAAGAYGVLSPRSAPAAEQAAAEEAAKPDAAKIDAPKPDAAKAEPPKPAEPSRKEPAHSASVVPSRRSVSSSLSEKIRSVREMAEKALEERRRKREEANAAAEASRKPRVEKKPAPVEKAPAAAPAAAPAPAERAASQPPPPAGAITGLSDGEVMVSKDRGEKIASAVPAAYNSSSQKDFVCPPGMARIPGGVAAVGSDANDDLRNFGDRPLARVELRPYCIDLYEYPNTPGKLPKVAAAWADAEAECKNAGKRLCSEDEWEAACRGPQNLRFPYGSGFDADACNTADKTDKPRQTNVSGAFARCRSGYGVMDLSGNAAEWTASMFDSLSPAKAVKGGHAARPGFDDRCASRRKLAPTAHDIKVGFRCCADAR